MSTGTITEGSARTYSPNTWALGREGSEASSGRGGNQGLSASSPGSRLVSPQCQALHKVTQERFKTALWCHQGRPGGQFLQMGKLKPRGTKR